MFRDLAEGKLSDIISNCWDQLKNPEARPSAEVVRWAVLSSWGEWEGRKAQWIVVTLGRTTRIRSWAYGGHVILMRSAGNLCETPFILGKALQDM